MRCRAHPQQDFGSLEGLEKISDQTSKCLHQLSHPQVDGTKFLKQVGRVCSGSASPWANTEQTLPRLEARPCPPAHSCLLSLLHFFFRISDAFSSLTDLSLVFSGFFTFFFKGLSFFSHSFIDSTNTSRLCSHKAGCPSTQWIMTGTAVIIRKFCYIQILDIFGVSWEYYKQENEDHIPYMLLGICSLVSHTGCRPDQITCHPLLIQKICATHLQIHNVFTHSSCSACQFSTQRCLFLPQKTPLL